MKKYYADSSEREIRINELKKEISIMNKYNEYLRLKYYNLMIYKISLLKELIIENEIEKKFNIF